MKYFNFKIIFNIFILILLIVSIRLMMMVNHESNDNELFIQRNNKQQRIKYNINCQSLIEMNTNEINKAQTILNLNDNIEVIDDKNYIFDSSMCQNYKKTRGYDKLLTISEQIEIDYPISYAILTYQHAEQIDRLLRLIWRPQNHYCFHIDSKSTDSFKQAIKSISNCFDNVFITNKSENIYWGSFSILQAELNCMQDLLNENKKWNYLIHMSGNEFPLKTNYELVKILNMYNGTNEIKISNLKMDEYRYKYKFDDLKLMESRYINLKKLKLKQPPPLNYSIMKGYTNAILSREFTEYVLTNQNVQTLIKWSKDMLIPDEMLLPMRLE